MRALSVLLDSLGSAFFGFVIGSPEIEKPPKGGTTGCFYAYILSLLARRVLFFIVRLRQY